MSNALAAMGIKRTIAECETLCKTTGTDGTSPKKLVRALLAVLGADSVAPVYEGRRDVAVLRLMAALQRGRAAILCVDEWLHWVAAIGVLGDRVLVADSADNELVLSLSIEELLERWEGFGRCKFWGYIL